MLRRCRSCNEHFKQGEKKCPHCGNTVTTASTAVKVGAVAVAVGAVLAGPSCSPGPAPLYGVPIMDGGNDGG